MRIAEYELRIGDKPDSQIITTTASSLEQAIKQTAQTLECPERIIRLERWKTIYTTNEGK